MNKYITNISKVAARQQRAIEYGKTISSLQTNSISANFKKYIEQINPKMEKKVETRILNNLYNQIKSPLLKTELLNSFKRRKLDLNFNLEKNTFSPDDNILENQERELDLNFLSDNSIENCSYLDIGKIFDFQLEHFLKVFPSINYGVFEYYENNIKRNSKFSILLTKEAFTVIEMLKKKEKLDFVSFEDLKIEELLEKTSKWEDLEMVYKDLEVFLKLIFTFGVNLRDEMEKLRFDVVGNKVLANSFLFDYLLLQLVWNLHDKEIRDNLLDSEKRKITFEKLFKQISEHPDFEFYGVDTIDKFAECQKYLKIGNSQIDLQRYKSHFRRIPKFLKNFLLKDFVSFNSNILFYGKRGMGKSTNLYAITMWAYKSKWIVAKLPSAHLATNNKVETLVYHEDSRLHLQIQFAEKILEDLYSCNSEIFAEMDVDMNIYGKFNLSGVHDEEPNPVPNFYIEDRQTYFYEYDKIKKKHDEEDMEGQEDEHFIKETEDDIEFRNELRRRLSNELPAPKKIKDIFLFAFQNPLLATNAIAEILEQIYNTEKHNVLIAIDDYNWLYRASNYKSGRYTDIKELNNSVPPYHFALLRLFIRFDGHRIKNGYKIAGTSVVSIPRHHFEPRKICFPDDFCVRLEGVGLKEFGNFKHFCHLHNLDYTEGHSERYARQLWMETQGNLGLLADVIGMPWGRNEGDDL